MSEQYKYQKTAISPGIFRAYDIRGLVDSQLTDDVFYTLGFAIANRLQALARESIYVARDGRLSSERFACALVRGLLDSGIDVLDIGAVATPVMYYATHQQGIDSGLMVTGSHNPAEYNGLKMVLAGTTLAHADIEIIRDLAASGKMMHGEGTYRSQDMMPSYLQRILQDVTLKRSLKVVVDCGNGIAGATIPKALTDLGCEVIPLYCEVDGRFPNHHPDPTVEENLEDLKQWVERYQADLGLAFDGDADRLGIITDQGEIIWPDRLMMLLSKSILERNQGATIVFDVKCSKHLSEVIDSAGGVAKMCPTGHSVVKRIMKEENAALAGEMSGHIFFKDRWYGFDDALYSACRLLELISQSSETIGEQFSIIPNSVNTPELKIPIPEEEKFGFMQRFIEQSRFQDGRLIRIDGLRVEFSNGWGLIRASNTTPCLVLRFEAENLASLESIQATFKAELLSLNRALQIPF